VSAPAYLTALVGTIGADPIHRQEAAAKSFESHPHLQIPQSSIEVMEIRPITGM
jgi:hypothetical protein